MSQVRSPNPRQEPHAVDGDPLPQDMQGFTYCFAVDYLEGEDHTIEKPALYDFWREYKPDFWPDKLLSLTAVKPSTNEPVEYEIFPGQGKSRFINTVKSWTRSILPMVRSTARCRL